MTKACQKCKEEGDDLRTLWMSCFYNMNELNIPFTKEIIIEGGIHDAHPNTHHNFFTLRVCKDCRADWMAMIRAWWNMPPWRHQVSPGTGIFIRDLGTNIEITEEEFYKRQKEKDALKNEKDI